MLPLASTMCCQQYVDYGGRMLQPMVAPAAVRPCACAHRPRRVGCACAATVADRMMVASRAKIVAFVFMVSSSLCSLCAGGDAQALRYDYASNSFAVSVGSVAVGTSTNSTNSIGDALAILSNAVLSSCSAIS